jgi:hypothetical protein
MHAFVWYEYQSHPAAEQPILVVVLLQLPTTVAAVYTSTSASCIYGWLISAADPSPLLQLQKDKISTIQAIECS